jgi:hypothetical protein
VSAQLAEAIAQLNLKPGECYRTTVRGHEVEVRILDKAPRAEPAEEASQFADGMMLDLWLDIQPSPQAKTLTARRGEPILPGRLELDESDLAPE